MRFAVRNAFCAVVIAAALVASASVGAGNAVAASTTPAVLPAAGMIATAAGGGPPDGVPATSVGLGPVGVVAAQGGGFLVTSSTTVYRVDSAGILTRVAGMNGVAGFAGDGGPATGAQLKAPSGVAVDAQGNLFIADKWNNRVRKVTPAGVISTVAGNGTQGFYGDGGLATSAELFNPSAVTVDVAGDVFIADKWNNRVRKVTPSGVISTVAGTGTQGSSGDGGLATTAQLNQPAGVALDAQGNLFIADAWNNRVRKVTPAGVISTVAGTGAWGFSGDGGQATTAELADPGGVAVDAAGDVFIADLGNYRVRKVTPSGVISTVAGTGTSGFAGDGGPATSAALNQSAGVRDEGAVAVDGRGDVLIADTGNYRVRMVSVSGVISTVAGNGTDGSGDGGSATSAQLNQPAGAAVDRQGNVFIADQLNQRVRKVTPSGVISTVAGTGAFGLSGDGGAATSAQLDQPAGVAVDAQDDVFIADLWNNRVRKVTPAGVISTIAGTGTGAGPGSFSGDGGSATNAQLNQPRGVAVDGAGDVFIADSGNDRVREVSPAGVISTVAGTGVAGFSGDGGPGTTAQLASPSGVAVDGSGNLFIADSGNDRVRKVNPAGVISTVAGNGTQGFFGDGGSATSAALNYPSGVAVDGAGDVFIADMYDARVREISPGGVISTVAGNGTAGFSGDGGPASNAALNQPAGVAVDGSGDLFIADQGNSRIRVVGASAPPPVVSGGTYSPVTPAGVGFPLRCRGVLHPVGCWGESRRDGDRCGWGAGERDGGGGERDGDQSE